MSTPTIEETKAVNDYEDARRKVHASPTVPQGAIKAETVYAESYQRLVRLGIAPQIKSKYHPKQVAHSRRAGS